MMPELIHPKQKLNHIRYGDARVFGEDSGERRKLEESAAIQRFGELWESLLSTNVECAPEITREEAEEMLEQKLKSFVLTDYTYRLFSLYHIPFIARVTAGGNCDQLWALGTHRDNTRLCVYFESNEARERFDEIAKKLGWEPKALGLQLLTDFTQKFENTHT